MRRLIALCLSAVAVAPAAWAADPTLTQVTLPPLPEWTDKYATQNKGDMRFFRIEKLMKGAGLDRLGAVEVQNRFRDLTRTTPATARSAAFRRALKDVRGGWRESGLTTEELAAAPFIVAFDLDDTLYDQYGALAACHDLEFTDAAGKTRRIRLTPGWDDAIRKVHQLGGLVVLFSANRDEVVYENLGHWKLDGVSIHESPLVGGVLTNSHLVVQEKSAGAPVTTPSKDLRILDEKLERVIIVDDNPLRLFQMRNARVFKKYRADDHCRTTDEMRKKAYEQAMAQVAREIEGSVAWMKQANVSFVTAYLPYTVLGQHAVDALRTANGWTEAQAVEHVRRHPDVVDESY